MSEDASEVSSSSHSAESIEVCNRKIPKSVMIQIFQFLNKSTLKAAAEVSKSFYELTKHPSLKIKSTYTGPNDYLPELQSVIPYPPPAALQTTIPSVTTVNPSPHLSTVLPESTRVILPVLPETVPLIAQVPDVVTTSVSKEGKSDTDKEIVQISQVLPGYAPSYAQEYVPTEVNNHSFSTFANTISFNVSRYPTLVEITDSKEYENKNKKLESRDGEKPSVVLASEDCSSKNSQLSTGNGDNKNFEYVPAEYFRGVENNFIQTVSSSGSVGIVKPDVLASGRVLTQMTAVQSLPATVSATGLTDSNDAENTSSLQNNDTKTVKSEENGHGHLNGDRSK